MAPSTAYFVIAHDRVPGRVRLRSSALRDRPDLEGPIQRACTSAQLVRGARANAVTGSVLLTFEEEQSLEDVLEEAQQAFEKVFGTAPRRPTWARRAVASLDRERAPVEEAPLPEAKKPAAKVKRRKHAKALPEVPARARAEAAPDEAFPWHTCGIELVLTRCETGRSGLSSAAAVERLARFGENMIAPPKKRSALAQFAAQFMNVPVALLGGSAVLSIATGGIGDAIAIGVVVLLNATIGFVTEREAERTLSLMGGSQDEPATVLRDGERVEVPARSLTVGDVLYLRPGDVVAADARLIEADRLLVDESSLTGESVPADKSIDTIPDDHVPLADRDNMIYRGTVISGGSGVAVIVATGDRTEIGRIQQLAGALEARETPLQAQLSRLSVNLVVGSAVVCGGVFVIGLLRGHKLIAMLKTSVSLAVAAVPEGLPTIAITTLALGIRRMRELDVIVRQLGAVETLGALQIVCLDKTGTITQNRMTVVAAHVNEQHYRVEGTRFVIGGEPAEPRASQELIKLLEVVTLCSEVEFENGHAPEAPTLRGSPTERALVETALAAGVDARELRARLPRRAINYRTRAQNYMYTVHDDDGETFVALKGNPSEVLALCSSQAFEGGARPLDDDTVLAVETENERLASQALRVLGVALRRGSAADLGNGNGNGSPSGFVWLGLIGMVDPPRDNIAALFTRLHAAGIGTVMITGDQSATAQSVARQIGLRKNGSLQILDSTRVDQLEPDVLRSLAEHVDVFSRVSPTHKLQIVQALQSAGRVVAMTGDGINDGPALKAADVGIALGQSGTTAAREVADVVLATDDLHSLITAVEHGRAIYDDIKKALRFILATNLSEILITLTAVAANLGEPLTPMQLLWINILSDVFPELALAVQPPEEDVLARPPRDPSAPIFDHRELTEIAIEGSVISASAMAAYGFGIARYGLGPRASSLAFMSLTSAQLLHAFSARSQNHSIFDPGHLARNPYIPLSIGGGLGLQLIAATFPPLRRMLGMTPLVMADWLVAGAGAVAPLIINELLKVERRTRARRARSTIVASPLIRGDDAA